MDSSLILLALSARELQAEPVKLKVIRALVQASDSREVPLDELLAREDWYGSVDAPDREMVEARLEGLEEAASLRDHYSENSIQVISPFDSTWPGSLEVLGSSGPTLLYVAGDSALLSAPAVGVVGSRNLDAAGAQVAADVAKEAVLREMAVVSGGARGADSIAMESALKAGGRVIGVLAHSLTQTMRDHRTMDAIDSGQLVLTTPFKPDSGFSVGSAMGRNKLIYALAAITAVIAADDGTGGTWKGADEALRRDFGRVAVWRGDGEGGGNEALAMHPRAMSFRDPTQFLAAPPEEERQTSLL